MNNPLNPEEEELATILFERIDRRKEGFVRAPDLLTALTLLSTSTEPIRKFLLLFQIFDADDDSCLSPDEIFNLILSTQLNDLSVPPDPQVAFALFSDELCLQSSRRLFETLVIALEFKVGDFVTSSECLTAFKMSPWILRQMIPEEFSMRWILFECSGSSTTPASLLSNASQLPSFNNTNNNNNGIMDGNVNMISPKYMGNSSAPLLDRIGIDTAEAEAAKNYFKNFVRGFKSEVDLDVTVGRGGRIKEACRRNLPPIRSYWNGNLQTPLSATNVNNLTNSNGNSSIGAVKGGQTPKVFGGATDDLLGKELQADYLIPTSPFHQNLISNRRYGSPTSQLMMQKLGNVPSNSNLSMNTGNGNTSTINQHPSFPIKDVISNTYYDESTGDQFEHNISNTNNNSNNFKSGLNSPVKRIKEKKGSSNFIPPLNLQPTNSDSHLSPGKNATKKKPGSRISSSVHHDNNDSKNIKNSKNTFRANGDSHHSVTPYQSPNKSFEAFGNSLNANIRNRLSRRIELMRPDPTKTPNRGDLIPYEFKTVFMVPDHAYPKFKISALESIFGSNVTNELIDTSRILEQKATSENHNQSTDNTLHPALSNTVDNTLVRLEATHVEIPHSSSTIAPPSLPAPSMISAKTDNGTLNSSIQIGAATALHTIQNNNNSNINDLNLNGNSLAVIISPPPKLPTHLTLQSAKLGNVSKNINGGGINHIRPLFANLPSSGDSAVDVELNLLLAKSGDNLDVPVYDTNGAGILGSGGNGGLKFNFTQGGVKIGSYDSATVEGMTDSDSNLLIKRKFTTDFGKEARFITNNVGAGGRRGHTNKVGTNSRGGGGDGTSGDAYTCLVCTLEHSLRKTIGAGHNH